LYNRQGTEVFTINGYNNADKVFRGFSNTGLFFDKGANLADGVYFYVIKYTVEGQTKERSGYLYITK
jgi:hypothetical protein